MWVSRSEFERLKERVEKLEDGNTLYYPASSGFGDSIVRKTTLARVVCLFLEHLGLTITEEPQVTIGGVKLKPKEAQNGSI